MNTGFLGPAVATVLTVYGIETLHLEDLIYLRQLQQCLPFTVLKLLRWIIKQRSDLMLQQCLPFTVLKPPSSTMSTHSRCSSVATVLTVYGIETRRFNFVNSFDLELQQCLPFTVLKLISIKDIVSTTSRLQQCLPFTVLKLDIIFSQSTTSLPLQQCLPFTVLKLKSTIMSARLLSIVATVLTVYGIETIYNAIKEDQEYEVATVLTVYGIET